MFLVACGTHSEICNKVKYVITYRILGHFMLILVEVFQEQNNAVWLLPAVTIRFLVGTYTWKGLCHTYNKTVTVWHHLKITSCPQKDACF
jgi:hypothetical protein